MEGPQKSASPTHATQKKRPRGRLAFERLLANLSAELMALPSEEVDGAIVRAQRRIVGHLGLDRCTVWARRLDDDLELTHQWARPGMASARLLARGALPWVYGRVMGGHAVTFSNLDELPPEAAVDRAVFEANGQRSSAALPLMAGGHVFGAMGFGTLRRERRWPTALMRRLRLLAQIVSHALYRKQAHESLKATEEAERRAREELAHVTRVAMLSELAGSLAHELHQPLTAIQTNAEAARRLASRAPEEVDEILRDIVGDVRRASEIVERAHALVRKHAFEAEVVDLTHLVREVLRFLRTAARQRRVTADVETTEPPPVMGDRVQLQQVILNLLVNGLDALEGAPVRRVAVVVDEADGHARVSVTDTGSGLSPALLENLFKPFHTTKRHGLGLGLSICRTIVRAHGGRIGARNNDDGGATFWFTVPLPPSAKGETSC